VEYRVPGTTEALMADSTTPAPFAPIHDVVAAVARGEMVVVVDEEDRENEGDLIMAASAVTPAQLGFFVRYTSGLICVAMEAERLQALQLPLMVEDSWNRESQGTAFTVSVDAREGTSTGISAADRCATIRALSDPRSAADDFVRPGHVFPLRARPGGVLKRAGHTEAAVDLTRMAGLPPAGVLAEIVLPDGSMARLADLVEFSRIHGLLLTSVDELIRYRRRKEQLVRRLSEASVPTEWGTMRAVAYESLVDGEQHLAIVCGDVGEGDPVLVRVHSECLTGDVFGSRRCDCGSQLRQALAMIGAAGRGVVVYLRGHEGRGIGIGHKLRAYALQDLGGHDTVDANIALSLPVDSREYGIGAQILTDLGVLRLRLMTNNPAKYGGLAGYGIDIVERVQLPPAVTPENVRYLRTKQQRMGHLLGNLDESQDVADPTPLRSPS
jgi:3,4-dihydroxy 2-butanone 4-phosphate synthase/GTP cyclohydrolase II